VKYVFVICLILPILHINAQKIESESSVLHYSRYNTAMAQVQFADEMSTTITFVDSEACTRDTVTGDAPR
jgi:hypothetical protein